MIEIKNLTKYYGKFKSLDNVSLKVKKGTIFGFIGPNGAGKSTTIKCMMNILNYTGEIYLDGVLCSIDNYSIKNNIGYLPSEIHIYDEMKVKDFLDYNNSFYETDCLSKAKKIAKELDLDLNKHIDQLSFGNQKKLGIVTALMHDPKILILDEPTSGLDPLIQDVFYKIIRREKENGKTIFLSSHNLSEVSGLCDEVAIIKDGKVLKIENINQLIGNKIVTAKGDINKLKKKVELIDDNIESIKFIYRGDVSKLLKLLSEYKLEDILIENPKLEDIFLSYYKED